MHVHMTINIACKSACISLGHVYIIISKSYNYKHYQISTFMFVSRHVHPWRYNPDLSQALIWHDLKPFRSFTLCLLVRYVGPFFFFKKRPLLKMLMMSDAMKSAKCVHGSALTMAWDSKSDYESHRGREVKVAHLDSNIKIRRKRRLEWPTITLIVSIIEYGHLYLATEPEFLCNWPIGSPFSFSDDVMM